MKRLLTLLCAAGIAVLAACSGKAPDVPPAAKTPGLIQDVAVSKGRPATPKPTAVKSPTPAAQLTSPTAETTATTPSMAKAQPAAESAPTTPSVAKATPAAETVPTTPPVGQVAPTTPPVVAKTPAPTAAPATTPSLALTPVPPRETPEPTPAPTPTPEAAAPTPTPAVPGNPVVVLTTSLGAIEIELDPVRAPVTAENFLYYVHSRYYDGTIFHRVIGNFMIQGGGYTPDMKPKETAPPIINESGNGLSNVRGSVAMARTPDLNSATSQFYINVVDNYNLDAMRYCVFGRVVAGMDVVDKIRAVPTQSVSLPNGSRMDDVPVVPVVILSAQVK